MCRFCPMTTWLAQYPDGVRYRSKTYFVQLPDEVSVELKSDRRLRTEREIGQIVVVHDVLPVRADGHALVLVDPARDQLRRRAQGARKRHVANRHDVQTEIERRVRA